MFLLSTTSASFGKYATMPMGWIFMVCIIIFEAVLMSKILKPRKFDFGIMFSSAISNVASGAIGAAVSKAINDGWMLIIWFPWVSQLEVDTTNTNSLFEFALYLAAAFIGTVFIEVIINSILLRRNYYFKTVMRATIITNVISYIIGCLIIYSYSFSFID